VEREEEMNFYLNREHEILLKGAFFSSLRSCMLPTTTLLAMMMMMKLYVGHHFSILASLCAASVTMK
jgi:hypothetical protein